MDIEIAIAAVSAFGSVASALAATIAAVGIWHFGRAMNRTNETRTALAEQQAKDAAEGRAQAAEDRAQAAEDRAQAVEDRAQAAEDRAQAVEDRKVTQAMLAALTELIRRTSPPPSRRRSR